MPSIGHVAVGAAAARLNGRELAPEHLVSTILFAFWPRRPE
ncbi:MAG TPA: hypothetical protein VLO07_02800 [Thermoanaerobaculia bacterium]|nr:hypothetical protein [Thermoanaerobaculia bacterium]